MRDMLQSHLLQLLTVVAMEPPAMDADAVRDEKVKVLKFDPSDSQALGACACLSRPICGRHRERRTSPGLPAGRRRNANSHHRNLCRHQVYIDNWRWRGVPFYLRTGKRMAEADLDDRHSLQASAATVVPRNAGGNHAPNWVLLSIQPEESMHMEMHVKKPGLEMDTRV